MPKGIVAINSSSFKNCTAIENIEVPQIETIGSSSFQGCSSLKSVITSDKLKKIGDYAFSNCVLLESIDLQGIESIGSEAFYNSGLVSVNLPKTTKQIGNGAFLNCRNINGVIDMTETEITNLPKNVFKGCSRVNVVNLPKTLKGIGSSCFADCEELESIAVPSTITEIAEYAFQNCESLESFEMPNALRNLGYNVFQNCLNLKEINFKDGFSNLRYGVFAGCERLKKVSFPQTITQFDFAAFDGCKRLDSIFFFTENAPEPLYMNKSYKNNYEKPTVDWDKTPFKTCIINIPARATTKWEDWNAVTESGGYFWDESLFGYKFQYGYFYEKLSGTCGKDGDNLRWELDTETGNLIIEGEGEMMNTTWTPNYPWQKRSCSVLSVEIREGVTKIGQAALGYCCNLKEVKLPNTVYEIGDYAFAAYGLEGSLKTINLPRNVKKIGKGILEGQNLDLMDLHMISPVSSGNPFTDCRCKKIFVHVGTIDLFKAAWGTPYTGYYGDYGEYVEKYADINIFDNDNGIVEGGGEYTIGDQAIVTAYPNDKYRFEGWSDGTKENPYLIQVRNDLTLAAIFVPDTHNLYYIINGDTIANYSLYAEEKIIVPEVPTKEGYTFSGWSEIPETMPAHDVTVTGTFTVNMYKLTYTVDGAEYKSYEVEYGTALTAETEPTKEGYTFSGWGEIPETMPAHDVTVTGTFKVNKYKLTYIVDGKEYKSSEVEYGAAITAEAEPTKEGYTFSGWSEIPATMPASDVTVTGTFTVNSYKVTYVIDDEVYETVSVDYGSVIVPPSVDNKEGYTFNGWMDIPETMPAHDVTVTGSFKVNSYTLTYMVDGEEYESYSIKYNASIEAEDEPTKEGYTFSGWSEIPATMPAHDVTVTGTFTVNTYKVTYVIDNEVYATDSVDYGAAITPPVVEDKEGYTFNGWADVPETMPANDITIYGMFVSGIAEIGVDAVSDTLIFTPQGIRVSKLQNGVNIVRSADGKTKVILRNR